MNELNKYIISYAQNREDMVLRSFFPDVENGFYIDIGANDPEADSVTKIFYDAGWRGINVEPNKKLYRKLLKKRPYDTNLNIGIGSFEAKNKLRVYENHGLSTFSKDMQKAYSNDSNYKTKNYVDQEIQIIKLDKLFNDFVPEKTTVHFMKIDVEGYEYEVIEGNNWAIYRPEIICIEANHIFNNWKNILLKNNYKSIFNDGLNEYFLRNESIYRSKYFNYAETFLLNKPIISSGIARQLTRIDFYSNYNTKLINEINNLKIINSNLLQKIEKYDAGFTSFHELVKQTLYFGKKTNNYILSSLHKKSYTRVTKDYKINISNLDSKEKLISEAKNYDIETGFSLKVNNKKLKLHYFILEELYRTIIYLFKFIMKLTIRIILKVKKKYEK